MHIVFVTTELAPLTPGGAGAVVARLRDQLTHGGDRVSVVLVANVSGQIPDGVTVVDAVGDFEARSRDGAEALADVASADLPDVIEFQDFDGLAFHALAHRNELGLDQIPIQVRFHGPADLMFEAIGIEPPEIATTRSMEASAFRMADRVVAPSASVGEFAANRYGLDDDRVVVGVPPPPDTTPIDLAPARTPILLCVGRLGEVKGTHDLVAAAVPLMREHPDLRLVVVGEDGWSATALKPMSEWLRDDLIPDDIADRVELSGRHVGAALDERIAEAWAVVVPSRFESFNLVAHEARAAGLPVIVPNLPAFEGVLDEATGALVYDGSRSGLTEAMRRIIESHTVRERLAAAPLPDYGDPMAPYETLPTIRHPRSQAGLGTAAVQSLERDRAVEVDESADLVDDRSRTRRTGYDALMWLSRPQATSVVDAIPARLRDKLGFVADWRDEMNRRDVAAQAAADQIRDLVKRSALDARVARGEFPDLDDPRVTVVIPCSNDGYYLDDAIRSVFKQTATSFEVIVVDDGSTDAETIDTIDALTWTRTRVIRQANHGLSAARNAGMAAARGTYVVPLDADDELEPRFLERMVAALEDAPNAALAACRARLFEDINAIWIPRPFNPYQLALSNSIIGCVLLRREAWRTSGGYDATMRNGNEDWELWIRLVRAGWDVVEVPEVLFRYRKHGISMSVETEARFEEGRAEIVARHRELYASDYLTSMKRIHYPLVSIIADAWGETTMLAAQNLDDAEIIVIGDTPGAWESVATRHGWRSRVATSIDEAIRQASGKFVVRWSDTVNTAPHTLSSLAGHLEADPNLGAAETNDTDPIVAVRRWSLLDPGAPSRFATIDVPGSGRHQLSIAQFPDPDWIFPTSIDDIMVQRQRPEEEGRIPAWVSE